MRYLTFILIISALFIAGCIEAPVLPEPLKPATKPSVTCRNVTEQVPITKEECSDVSYTEQVCVKRKLNYTKSLSVPSHLCIGDGKCVGEPLSECTFCTKAMTRCIMTITNKDPKRTGTWTVKANYTLGNSGFEKEGITKIIGPNESATFDFHQIYIPGYPTFSATCILFVADEPVIDECHEETSLKKVCKNVTSYTTREKQVCN